MADSEFTAPEVTQLAEGLPPQGRAVHGESLANRRAALAALLSQLPRSDLETLRKALAPLERLASGEPASGPASNSPARKRA